MIDVGVGQQDGSDGLRVESQATILMLGLLAATLKQPAIHQDVTAGDLDEMATASDRPRRAVKRELHAMGFMPSLWAAMTCHVS